MKTFISLLLAVTIAANTEAAPATLAKGVALDVMSGATRIGSRNYAIGTNVDAVSAENGKIRVTTDDGATGLLPAGAVVYAPTPTPKPSLPPSSKPSGSPSAAGVELRTLSGKVYKNARIFRVEPDGINYAYEGGVVKIPFTDLPESLQKQYGYDPDKARKFAAQDAAEQQQGAESQERALHAIERAKNVNESLQKLIFYMSGKIIQVTDEGALVDGSISHEVVRSREVDTSTMLEKRSVTQNYQDVEMVHLDEPIFVYGLGGSYVDGDHVDGLVWLVGKHHYTAVSGAGKTVRAFAASKEDAAKRIESGRGK